MKLLLLLSALLSALTGAGGPARAMQTPVAVSRVAEKAAVQRITGLAAHGRPIQALPVLRRDDGGAAAAWVFAPATPLYASRRRE
ncbi:hypothetical protein [Sphingomonas sp.]|uniref:hypothetical protein n=1 Tax=Sphingomonas sp. TaxID=28214 RepID=UPI003CC6C49D